MFLVINAKGQMWDGLGWNEQGKEFFSIAAATRSLHEEGEDLEDARILSTELATQ
jgi:hypothetical protein